MSKRQNDEASGDDGPTGPASKRARITPGTAPTTENPTSSSGLKNTLHGTVFQLKLLALFLLRGINAGIEFRLGTEIPGMGGKFDDLIFKFKKRDETSESYRFLQAKHKQDEEKKITAADLLQDNEKGDFSLPKYFRAYCHDIIKLNGGILPENIQECIICTNIGFDSEDNKLKNGSIKLKPEDDTNETKRKKKRIDGIELIRLDDHDNILSFDKTSDKKIPVRYRLKKTEELCKIMAGWSDVHLLAKTLLDYVTDKKQLTLSLPILKSYHVALVEEKVIDKEEGKLCASFMNGDNSTRFRKILSELTFVYDVGKQKINHINSRIQKPITQFDEKSLIKHLPKYSKTESMEMNYCIFENYDEDLIAQNIIDATEQTTSEESFTDDFLHGINLSPEKLEKRGELRNTVFIHYWKDLTVQLSKSFGKRKQKTTEDNKSLKDLVGEKEIGDFLDKLVFAVQTPNEVELDDILKNEVGKHYNLHENDFQSDFILRNMLDWFKEKESKFMTSDEGKEILENGKEKMESLRVTAISIDYQKQSLKEVLEFNEKAIKNMKEKLTQLLTAENRIGRIATPLPKRTAVEVIAALKELRLSNDAEFKKYFQYEDSYLVTSSSRLQMDSLEFIKTLESKHSHHRLVVVCEDGPLTENDDEFYQKLVYNMLNKRIIIISQGGAEVEDKLNFGDLNEKSKRALLEKQIDFQGTLKSVGDLIKRGDTTLDDLIENGNPEEVIDSNSIEELLIEKEKILIPTCSSERFEPELYVERQMEHPLENARQTTELQSASSISEDTSNGVR